MWFLVFDAVGLVCNAVIAAGCLIWVPCGAVLLEYAPAGGRSRELGPVLGGRGSSSNFIK